MNPPSFVLRVLLALGFLIGFYVVTIALSLALFAGPIVFTIVVHQFSMVLLFLFAVCWIPGGLFLSGLLGVRPPPFTPPGPRLERAEAPELFAILEELAARAGTVPPIQVYLACVPQLAVTETGGFWGGKRVLVIGLPLLEMTSIQELRAGLAHELGHFAGGDTRLAGILSFTTASFASMIRSVQRGAFREGTSHSAIEAGFAFARALGEVFTNVYAHVFFRVMRASSRRQELAADALAAKLAGREATMRLLDKASIVFPTYDLYLLGDVACAMNTGAMPTDLLAGYRAFRAVFDQLPFGVQVAERQRAAKTDPFDSHPSHADRAAHLRTLAEGPREDDARPAVSLLVDADKAHAWLTDATIGALEPKRVLTRVTWAEVPSAFYTPFVTERARKIAAQLFSQFPDAPTLASMFVSVVSAFERGEAERVVTALVPQLSQAHPSQRATAVNVIGGSAIGSLFEGALVERGGTLEASFGAPSLVVRFEGESFPAAKIGKDAMSNDGARALLGRWAERLSSAA
jgi:Zn-dependent protease with chaperone function